MLNLLKNIILASFQTLIRHEILISHSNPSYYSTAPTTLINLQFSAEIKFCLDLREREKGHYRFSYKVSVRKKLRQKFTITLEWNPGSGYELPQPAIGDYTCYG